MEQETTATAKKSKSQSDECLEHAHVQMRGHGQFTNGIGKFVVRREGCTELEAKIAPIVPDIRIRSSLLVTSKAQLTLGYC